MEIEEPIGKWIYSLTKNYRSFLKTELSKLGFDINPRESDILLYLYRNGDGKSQEDISELVGVNKATVSRAISDMVEKKLLNRKISKSNKSMYLIYLTEEAKKMESGIRGNFENWVAMITRNIKPEEQRCFVRLIKKMLDNSENPITILR